MTENFEKYNIGWVLDKNQDPLYMDLDNPMVKDLWRFTEVRRAMRKASRLSSAAAPTRAP